MPHTRMTQPCPSPRTPQTTQAAQLRLRPRAAAAAAAGHCCRPRRRRCCPAALLCGLPSGSCAHTAAEPRCDCMHGGVGAKTWGASQHCWGRKACCCSCWCTRLPLMEEGCVIRLQDTDTARQARRTAGHHSTRQSRQVQAFNTRLWLWMQLYYCHLTITAAAAVPAAQVADCAI